MWNEFDRLPVALPAPHRSTAYRLKTSPVNVTPSAAPPRSTAREWIADALALLVLVAFWVILFRDFLSGERSFADHFDATYLLAPVFSRVASLLAQGDWPLYLDSSMAGLELYNSAQFTVYYPLYPFHFVAMDTPLKAERALNLFATSHIVIGAINTYALCRGVGLERAGALLGGTVYCSARNTWIYAAWINIIAPYTWLPLLMLGLFQVDQGQSRRGVVLIAVSLVLIILASPAQPLIHALVLLGSMLAWWLIRGSLAGSESSRHAIIATAVTLCAVCVICAFVIVPTAGEMSAMIRWLGPFGSVVGNQRLPFDAFVIDQGSPWSLASVATGRVEDGLVGSTFIGWASLLLLCLSAFVRPRSGLFVSMVILAAYGLLSSYGTSFGLAYANYMIPLVNKIREPSRHLVLFVTGSTVLVAMGARVLRERVPAAVFTALVGVMICSLYAQMHPLAAQRYRKASDADVRGAADQASHRLLADIAARKPGSLVKIHDTEPEALCFGMNACYTRGTVAALDGNYQPRRYETHLRLQAFQPSRPDLMRLAGVNAVVKGQPRGQGSDAPPLTAPRFETEDIAAVRYPTVFRNVDSNQHPFRITHPDGSLKQESSTSEAIAQLLAWESAPESVEVVENLPNYKQFRIQSQGPGLFAADNFYSPNWKYTVDGVTVPSEPINVVRQAVAVGEGTHTIEMRYQPPLLWPLWILCGVGILSFGVIVAKLPQLQTAGDHVLRDVSLVWTRAWPGPQRKAGNSSPIQPLFQQNVRTEVPQTAWADWWAGTRNVDLWATLAWYDILLRYRRSLLGPLWLTLSMGIMLLGMGPLYSGIFHVPLTKFFPHLTLGIIFWSFFSSTITDACTIFTSSAPYLKQSEFPRSVFVWRSIARNIMQLAHHIVLFVPVAFWAGIHPSMRMLWFIPGLLVVIVNLHAITITLGFACARFRDVTQIVISSLQMFMFLTPVFWFPESLPGRSRFILYNPLAQLLDLLRLPLLGAKPATGTWWFLLYFTALNVALAAFVYARKRRDVVYWL